MRARFYVYQLVDPRDESVFYIGKGTGSRMFEHETEVLKGKAKNNARKIERIQAIHAAELKVKAVKVCLDMVEADAMDLERRLIAETPGLTNILAGGQGWGLSEEEFARREAQRAAIWAKKARPANRKLVIAEVLRRICTSDSQTLNSETNSETLNSLFDRCCEGDPPDEVVSRATLLIEWMEAEQMPDAASMRRAVEIMRAASCLGASA